MREFTRDKMNGSAVNLFKIEQLRDTLYEQSMNAGLQDPKTLKLSQALDILMNQYIREVYFKNKTSGVKQPKSTVLT